jgi:hypothetical protein
MLDFSQYQHKRLNGLLTYLPISKYNALRKEFKAYFRLFRNDKKNLIFFKYSKQHLKNIRYGKKTFNILKRPKYLTLQNLHCARTQTEYLFIKKYKILSQLQS